MRAVIRRARFCAFYTAELHTRQWYRSLAAKAQEKLNASEAFRTQQPRKALSFHEIIGCALEAAPGCPTTKASTRGETEGETWVPTKMLIPSENLPDRTAPTATPTATTVDPGPVTSD